MPLDALHSPASFAMTAARWRRPEIEAAVEWLIGLLDARDADADLEPDPEGERGDGLAGDEDDAEDALLLERMRVARLVRRRAVAAASASPRAASPTSDACASRLLERPHFDRTRGAALRA